MEAVVKSQENDIRSTSICARALLPWTFCLLVFFQHFNFFLAPKTVFDCFIYFPPFGLKVERVLARLQEVNCNMSHAAVTDGIKTSTQASPGTWEGRRGCGGGGGGIKKGRQDPGEQDIGGRKTGGKRGR